MKIIPVLIVLLAAVRVLIMNAAFPLFNPIDEFYHVDLVIAYSHCHFPHANMSISEESAGYQIAFGTTEYLDSTATTCQRTPPWKTDPGRLNHAGILAQRDFLLTRRNIEEAEPPLYYAVAALWWSAGRLLGINGGYLVYWLRSMNAVLFAAMVLLTILFVKRHFPDDAFMQLAAPLLVACAPQDVFYGVNNSNLAAVLFAASLVSIVSLIDAKDGLPARAAGAGLLTAAALLTKCTTAPLVLVAPIAFMLRGRPLTPSRRELFSPALFVLCLTVPLAVEFARNRLTFHDLLGTATKARIMGWTELPLGRMFLHPIFTAKGFFYFVINLTTSLWRGELLWKGGVLAVPAVDGYYAVSTALLCGAAFVWILSSRERFRRHGKAAAILCVSIALSGVMLAFFSIRYDFGTCFSPSRDLPYFTNGRLICGILPFLFTFYAIGMRAVFGDWRNGMIMKIALAATCLVMTGSDIIVSLPAFGSQFNFFHTFN